MFEEKYKNEIDALYPRVIALLPMYKESGILITDLQRKLRRGYIFCALIMERLEKNGLVTGYNGATPRKVNLKPKFYRGKAYITPGDIYEIDGKLYEVITGTSQVIGGNAGVLNMTEIVYWLDNFITKERRYFKEKELQSIFKEKKVES